HRFKHEVARAHAVEVFGQFAIESQHVIGLAALNAADEDRQLRLLIERERDREGSELSFEQAQGELTFTGQPLRSVDHQSDARGYPTEVREHKLVVGIEFQAWVVIYRSQ